ncbi:MAG: glycosyltransferase family 2 protein [Lachnospiraceae bacterium]|nr:glycosyltransferase family 2 protein [Lachnospiraceae bacterium]
MDKRVLIIIPAYNEAENIEKVVKSIEGRDYIIINDGSTDDTANICKQNNYNFIDLPVNLGLIGAFQTGLKYALQNDYSYALQFDGDGQHQPQFIDGMVSFAEETSADIVIGSRFVEQKKPFSARMLGSRLLSGLIWLFTHKKIADPTSGMRLYNKKTMAKMASDINLGPEPDTISYFLKCKASVKEFQVEMKERQAGESYLNFTSSIKYMWKMCCSILVLQIMRGR